MAWVMCTSGAAITKAGTHAGAITISGAELAVFSDEAEGWICSQCNSDFVTSWGSLGTQIQNTLGAIASSLVAQNIIIADTTGYLAREADMLMNWNDAIVTKGLAKLKERENQKLATPPY